MPERTPYSKVTKKGQITIPVLLRRKQGLAEGVLVRFEEYPEGLVIKPVPDIVDSAGKLSTYARPKEVIRELLQNRKEEFR